MEAPYVLAKVYKSTSTADLHIYAAPCLKSGPRQTSTCEVAVAIDAQGINIYDMHTNQVVISYSLSPSTKFHCPPISVIDRAAKTRTTYAALQTGADLLRIQSWTESTARTVTEPKNFEVKKRVRDMCFTTQYLFVLFIDGTLEQLSIDLSCSVRSISVSKILSMEDVIVQEHKFLIASNASQEIPNLHIITAGNYPSLIKIKTRLQDGSMEAEVEKTTIDVAGLGGERKFAIGDDAQLLMLNDRKDLGQVYAVLYDEHQQSSASFQIARSSASTSIQHFSARWISKTQLVICSDLSISIYDSVYMTCLSSTRLPAQVSIVAVAPQRKSQLSSSYTAYLIACNADTIYLTEVTYSKNSTLKAAIGSKDDIVTRTSEIWVQDIDLHSTWKESLTDITQSARQCLKKLRMVTTAAEFDQVFMEYHRKQKDGMIKGKHLITAHGQKSELAEERQVTPTKKNGHIGKKQTLHVTGHMGLNIKPNAQNDRHVLDGNVKGKPNHDLATQSALSTGLATINKDEISVSYIDQIILLMSAPTLQGIPWKSITFLLSRRLLSFASYGLSSSVWQWVRSQEPKTKLRFLGESTGLLPEQTLDLLKAFLHDDARLHSALSIAIAQLDIYDEVMVVVAIRKLLTAGEIDIIMKVIETDLQARLADGSISGQLTEHSDLLCASVTNFLDALGVSNLMLSSTSKDLLASLKAFVAQLIAMDESISATANCLAELLLKAKLIEERQAEVTRKLKGGVEANPEPQPKATGHSLDQIKKKEKGRTRRAKAHAQYQSIGSVYTIETIQI